MPDKKEYLTKEKFDELTKELEFLRKDKRKEVAESLEYAKSLGDLSENAEYHEARDNQAEIEDRISKLETMLANAAIVEAHHTDKVGIGSTVTVSKPGDSKTLKLEIVGSEEADAKLGKISMQSPMGEALVGKKKGESFTFESPRGNMTYTVISIE
jgi:transcription elongation factor GreA